MTRDVRPLMNYIDVAQYQFGLAFIESQAPYMFYMVLLSLELAVTLTVVEIRCLQHVITPWCRVNATPWKQ